MDKRNGGSGVNHGKGLKGRVFGVKGDRDYDRGGLVMCS